VAVDQQRAPLSQPAGYYLLDQGGLGTDPALNLLRNPKISGLTIRARWSALNPDPREFNWTEIERPLKLAERAGKPAKLIIQTGRDYLSPAWIGGQRLWYQGKTIPAPWSPQLSDAWMAFCDALGREFRGESRIKAAHITGPTWPSAEMHPMPGLKNQRGYSQQAMVTAWDDAAAGMLVAFPDPGFPLSLSISTQAEAGSYVRDVISRLKGRLGDRLRLQHNALAEKTSMTAPHHVLLRQQWQLGVRIWFEMVCSAQDDPVRFGSGDVMDGVQKGRVIGGELFDIYPRPGDVAALS
jgi:hypothetical protein